MSATLSNGLVSVRIRDTPRSRVRNELLRLYVAKRASPLHNEGASMTARSLHPLDPPATSKMRPIKQIQQNTDHKRPEHLKGSVSGAPRLLDHRLQSAVCSEAQLPSVTRSRWLTAVLPPKTFFVVFGFRPGQAGKARSPEGTRESLGIKDQSCPMLRSSHKAIR